MKATRLPSAIWSDLFGIIVCDPDGWDRKNYDESWGEYITEEEFISRASHSTIMMRPASSGPQILNYFYKEYPHV